MIGEGLSLAALTGLAFYFIFQKMPASVRRLCLKYPLVTDAIACIITYILFGGTLVALFASAWMGLIVSVILALMSNENTAKMLESFSAKVVSAKNKLIQKLEDMQKKPRLELVGDAANG